MTIKKAQGKKNHCYWVQNEQQKENEKPTIPKYGLAFR